MKDKVLCILGFFFVLSSVLEMLRFMHEKLSETVFYGLQSLSRFN